MEAMEAEEEAEALSSLAVELATFAELAAEVAAATATAALAKDEPPLLLLSVVVFLKYT